MYDNSLLLRDGSADLTTTTTGSIIDFGGGDVQPLTYDTIVPSVAGTNPTFDLVIETSDSPTFATTQDKVTLPQIVAAGVYRVTFKSPHRYRRYVATIGGTGSPNFGKVFIAPSLGGEDNKY